MQIRRWFRYRYLKLLRTRDHPASVAKGIAIGVALDFLPTFGTGLIFAYILAVILKINRIVAVGSAILFKWAIPFFYLANLTVGQFILGRYADSGQPVVTDIAELFRAGGWHAISKSFLLGSAVNASFAAAISFVLSYRFISHRRSRQHKLRIKHSFVK